jgi:hypothetical protein
MSCRSQWPHGLRRRSTAARLLRSWIRNPPGAMMFVCCVCCVLSGRGLCDELITRPEESYRLWRVVCDHEKLVEEEAIARAGLQSQRNNIKHCVCLTISYLTSDCWVRDEAKNVWTYETKQNKKRIKSKFLVTNVQAGVTGSDVLKAGIRVSPRNLVHLLIIEGILTMYYRFC